MGLLWYCVYTIVLNDFHSLIAIHKMHIALIASWAGSMALCELALLILMILF